MGNLLCVKKKKMKVGTNKNVFGLFIQASVDESNTFQVKTFISKHNVVKF